MMKLKECSAALLFALLLCACAPAQPGASPSGLPPESPSVPSAPAPEPAENNPAGNPDRLYHLYRNEHTVVMDASGRLLGEDEAYTPLYDMLTGEEQYRYVTRHEDTGEDDEYGNPVVQDYNRLYDAAGNLLYDWEPVTYRTAFSGLLIRQDPRDMWAHPTELLEKGYSTALWNPATGETVIEGIDTFQEMGDGSFLALDVAGRLLGVLDGAGGVLSGFPVPEDYYYPSAGHGFIVGDKSYNPYGPSSDGKPTSLLLDRDYRVLLDKEQINLGFYGLRGPYLLWRDAGQEGILSLPDLAECITVPDSSGDIQYFDGERMILRSGDHRDAANPWRYTLCDAQGAPLAGPYEQLAPEDEYISNSEPASQFVALDGDVFRLLDRDGKLLASSQHESLGGVSPLGEGYYAYEIEKPAATPNSFSERSSGLLGPGLTEIIPAGRYDTIQRMRSWGGRSPVSYDLLECGKTLPNGVWRYDILDLTGKPILTNLSAVGDAGPNRIAVVRGFSMGLVDFSGNWIAEYSVYDDLQGD